MSDPIRDALAEVVRSLVRSCVENGVDPMLAAERAIGAQAVLTAYDQAKFQLGDTTDAPTITIRKRKK
jgi:hypothetical protein